MWFWGLCGAFAYAGPRLMKAWRETEHTPWRWWIMHLSEAAQCLIVGVIFATVATPFLGHRFPWTVEPSPIALATAIGLYANQAEPILRKLMTRWITKQADGG
jgi:hypothetical protein